MKNYLLKPLVILSLCLPISVFAIQDVTLGTSMVIHTGGINLTLSGGVAADRLVVNDANSFTLTLSKNSTVALVSTDKRTMTFSQPAGANQLTTSLVCNSGNSTYTIANPTAGATGLQITVTPTATVCASGAGSGGGSSGGGGGGGGGGGSSSSAVASAPAASAAPAPAVVVAVAPAAVISAPVSSVSFKLSLRSGQSSPDVKKIQEILNSDPDTRIASSGAGSPGHETLLLGGLTVKAIKKFQVKYGIAKPGDAGYGNLGPKTRAKLADIYNQKNASASQPAQSPSSAQPAASVTLNSLLQQLSALQDALKKLKAGQ